LTFFQGGGATRPLSEWWECGETPRRLNSRATPPKSGRSNSAPGHWIAEFYWI